MLLHFILSIAFIIACCLLSAQSFQPQSYKVKAQAKSYSTDRLSNNNFRLFKPDAKVHGILFAQPDRKITRDSEDEYFEADFDRKPLSERLPFAYAFLGFVSLPFIVGLLYLYSQK